MKGSLSVKDADVRIEGSHILQGVSFEAKGGGVTAVLGRNGAGKTTTLKACLGLVPRTGTFSLDGASIEGLPTHQIVQLGVGYVPEDREVFGTLTVQENLSLAERKNCRPRYDLVYELFPELADRSRQTAGTLSGGQQQMVAIARAMLNDNCLLLVDEPTKGLAPLLVDAVAEAIRRAAEETTVVLVEQNLAFIKKVASVAIVIEQGRVVHHGEVNQLLADDDRVEDLLGVGRTRG